MARSNTAILSSQPPPSVTIIITTTTICQYHPSKPPPPVTIIITTTINSHYIYHNHHHSHRISSPWLNKIMDFDDLNCSTMKHFKTFITKYLRDLPSHGTLMPSSVSLYLIIWRKRGRRVVLPNSGHRQLPSHTRKNKICHVLKWNGRLMFLLRFVRKI